MTSGTVRVVYLWPYLDWGGVQIYFLNLIGSADPAFEADVVVPTAAPAALRSYLHAEGVELNACCLRATRGPSDVPE